MGFVVAADDDVGDIPALFPARFVGGEEVGVVLSADVRGEVASGFLYGGEAVVVAAGGDDDAFFKGFRRRAHFGFEAVGHAPVAAVVAGGGEVAGEGLFGVNDELVNAEGVGDGLGGNAATVGGNVARQYLPEFFFVVGVFVFHVGVNDGVDAYFVGFAVGGGDVPADERQFFLRDGEEFADAELDAEEGELAVQDAAVHVEFEDEVGGGVFAEVNFLAVNVDGDFAVIQGVDGFAEVFGVAVFPPADTGFVREPHAADVGAEVAVAAVGFFEVAAHTHVAVAEAGQAFLQALVFFFQFGAADAPGVDFHDSQVHIRVLFRVGR